MSAPTVNTKTVAAMLLRGQTRMVQAYVNEGGLIDPVQMHTYWRGFANCAQALLDGTAERLASNDAESQTDGLVQAAFARLPVNLERLTLADMKRHMWAQGIHCAADLVATSNVNAVNQLQDRVSADIKQDDEHAVARVDVRDGAGLHGASLSVIGLDIVAQGGAA